MRTSVIWFLRRVAGEELARDIVGDVAESGGGVVRLAAIAAGIMLRRGLELLIAHYGQRRGLVGLFGDLRYAVRSLKRAPWYAATTVGVIALSMALATTVFAVVDGVLFRPLPYTNVSELYAVNGAWRADTIPGHYSVSWSDITAWQNAIPEARFAVADIGDRTSVDGDPLRSAAVSPEFFERLGQPLLMGGFRPQDFVRRPRGAAKGVAPVVLTYGTWRGRFGGDPAIVGKIFHGDEGAVSEIVGVTSPRFLFPLAFSGVFVPEVLTPLRAPADPAGSRERGLVAIARIPGGRALADLNARVQGAQAALALRFVPPAGARGRGPFDVATVTPIDTMMRSYQKRTFTIVFLAAAMLVVLACLNITGLAAARTEDRVRELTLRRALGGRGRDLVRLLGAESAIVIAAGSSVGLIAARLLLPLIEPYLPPESVLLKAPVLDLRVAAFASVAAAMSIGVTTVWPARKILRQSSMPGADAGRVTRRDGRLGRFALIGSEIMLALVMAVGGALMAGSLARLWREDAGFQVDRVLSVQIAAKSEASWAEVGALLEDARRVPGVAGAGASTMFLLQRAVKGSSFDPPAGANTDAEVESIGITSGFFETAGLRLVSGRWPTTGELSAGAPVALVSERVTRDYWHSAAAVGHELMNEGRPFAVIGVVPDTRNISFDRDPDGAIYYPVAAGTRAYSTNLLVASVDRTPDDVIHAVSAMIDSKHSKFRVRSAQTLRSALGGSIRLRSFQTMLFASFGAAAVLIVGAGVLGLVAMVTSRRTREVGVRMALGANPSQIAALVVRQELTAVFAGLAAGALISYWAVGLVRTYLYKVDAYDSRIWIAAIVVLLATSALGAFLPARRASRVDPVKALRVE